LGCLSDEAVSSSESKAAKLYLNNVSLLKMEMLALSADWQGAGAGIIILPDNKFGCLETFVSLS